MWLIGLASAAQCVCAGWCFRRVHSYWSCWQPVRRLQPYLWGCTAGALRCPGLPKHTAMTGCAGRGTPCWATGLILSPQVLACLILALTRCRENHSLLMLPCGSWPSLSLSAYICW